MCVDQKAILIVDDDAAIRDTMADVLRDEGYTTFTAKNGKDALDQLQGGLRPCLIFLDLMMPVMTGAEFWNQMQANPDLSAIPVVVISADGNVERKAQALSGKYLVKPVKVDPVLNTVEQYCA